LVQTAVTTAPPATLSFQNRDIAEFPAYESDPEEGPKIVPREKWFAAPAAPDRQD
jgi:hypothetical protein